MIQIFRFSKWSSSCFFFFFFWSLFSSQEMGRLNCEFCVVGQRNCEADTAPVHLYFQKPSFQFQVVGELCTETKTQVRDPELVHRHLYSLWECTAFPEPHQCNFWLCNATEGFSLNLCPPFVRQLRIWKAIQQGKLHHYFNVIRIGERRGEMWGKVPCLSVPASRGMGFGQNQSSQIFVGLESNIYGKYIGQNFSC